MKTDIAKDTATTLRTRSTPITKVEAPATNPAPAPAPAVAVQVQLRLLLQLRRTAHTLAMVVTAAASCALRCAKILATVPPATASSVRTFLSALTIAPMAMIAA